jgi:hypothetical protein
MADMYIKPEILNLMYFFKKLTCRMFAKKKTFTILRLENFKSLPVLTFHFQLRNKSILILEIYIYMQHTDSVELQWYSTWTIEAGDAPLQVM